MSAGYPRRRIRHGRRSIAALRFTWALPLNALDGFRVSAFEDLIRPLAISRQ